MLTLEELLNDSQLTDDIEIALPNGKKTTVKDLRLYASTMKSASDTAIREAQARKDAADAEIAKAKRLATDSLALYEQARAVKVDDDTKVKPGDIDWENDPVYRPVGQRFSKLEKESLAKVNEEIEKIHKALGAGLKFVTDQYQEQRWNALPKDARPKDKTWRDYLKAAEEQNIKDSYGLFDPLEAFNRATAADREAAKMEAARKAGIEEGKKLAAQANLPRPGGNPVARRDNKDGAFKDLRSAMEAAQHDPEIIRIASGEPA